MPRQDHMCLSLVVRSRRAVGKRIPASLNRPRIYRHHHLSGPRAKGPFSTMLAIITDR